MLDVDKQPEWEGIQTGTVSAHANSEHLTPTKERKNETLSTYPSLSKCAGFIDRS